MLANIWLREILKLVLTVHVFTSRTWLSTIESADFCPGGSNQCVNAKLANCQDRTIQCLATLPTPDGMIKKDITDNSTLNSHSLGAKFQYTCQTDGKYFVLIIQESDLLW